MKYIKIIMDDRKEKERTMIIKQRVWQIWSPSGYLN